MAPRKVLYLHTTSEVGGSDVSLAQLVERLDRARYRPLVALPSDGPLAGRLEKAGARVFVLPAMKKLTSRRGKAWLGVFALNYPFGVAAVASLIRREHVDIVHTNTIHNLYGWAAARLTGRPHVWHVREIVWQNATLLRLERALALRHSARVIVTSDAVAAMFKQEGGLPAHVIKIPNGIDVARYAPGRSSLVREDFGIPADAPLVGAAARMDVWKGLDDFIQAVAIVHRVNPSARFVIAGGPIAGLEEYEQALRALARGQGVDRVLFFAGWRYGPDAMPEFYRSLDVFVLPSKEPEPFGLVVLEAMASGRPVVATAHGGPVEILRHGETGVLVEPKSPGLLASEIAWLIAEPERARAIGEAARAHVAATYDISRTVARLQQVYDTI